MPTRRPSPPPPPEIKHFTSDEIEQGIRKLRRRLEEIQAIDPQQVAPDDQRKRNTYHKLEMTISEVFGQNSAESREFTLHEIREANDLQDNRYAGSGRDWPRCLGDTATFVQGLIERLEEKRVDLGHDTTSRVRAAFEGLDLHPRIAAVCAALYRGGHYRNAVLDASLALERFVKDKSQRDDLSGAELMRTVFSAKTPVLPFNDLRDDTDRSEQEGLMHLFEGAVLALRNPRAHTLLDDSPEMALEYIALLSLLAKRLEQASGRAGS